MFQDPIVEEIRSARQKHASLFKFDLKKIAEELNKKQAKSKRKVVSYPPKLSKIENQHKKLG